MWRMLRIAYAGGAGDAYMKLVALLPRLGLQEHIDRIGAGPDAVSRHREDPYDIIFMEQTLRNGIDLGGALREVSPEMVLLLLTKDADAKALAAAVNEAHIDWVLPLDFSDSDLKDALVWSFARLEERRGHRELLLGQGILRAARTPAAIIDRNYHVIYANRAAESLFDQGDPFQVTTLKQLVCATTEATQRFHDELCTSLHKHFQSNENAFIRIDRQDGRRPVIAVSIPAIETVDNRYTYHLVFNDLDKSNPARAEDFALALNLSVAEGRLVQAMALGLNLEQASSEINVSLNTARSYLKSVFEKTGVTRQAELVRLALLAVH